MLKGLDMDSAPAACTPQSFRTPPPPFPGKRESRALTLRADGASFGTIAGELGIHVSTASRLVARGMQRLGVSTQAELITALRSRDAPSAATPPSAPTLAPALTAAEREVVALVLQGLSNAEIGARRRTAARTVANQLQAIYQKVGVGSRSELIAAVLR